RAKVPGDDQAATERFLAEYYRQVDPDDLAELDTADIYGAALSHLAFARRREPGMPKVRVFNPSIEEHGWQSTHTVVEIVNDDMPFLVDSVTTEVNRSGLALHLLVHPVLQNRRDAAGQLLEPATSGAEGVRESFMHVEVDRLADADSMEALAADLTRVLNDVRLAVADWRTMLGRLEEILGDLDRRPPPVGGDELEEGQAFLRWLGRGHFTFLGYRLSDLERIDGADALCTVPGSGLGILRGQDEEGPSASFAALPPEARAYARVKDLLVLTKSNSRSTVHRPGYLDYVGIKRYDAQGEVCGEHRFVGLYTHIVYGANPVEIPLLRRKVANVMARAGFAAGGHAAKALEHVLETYPRDELFQIGEHELLANALGILHLGERQRLRLFVRRDAFERFCVCLIYAPREHYTTELRRRWQAVLMQAFNGLSSEFNVFLSESVLARIVITVRTRPGHIPRYEVADLEERLAAASRRWGDDLRQALLDTMGEAGGNLACRRFGAAFPAAYREDYPARNAVPDIERMQKAIATGTLGMNLYRPVEASPGTLRLKLFHPGRPAVLSESLPMLERMGLSVLEQRPYRITPDGAPPVWIEDLGLATRDGTEIEIDALRENFEETFGRVFAGTVENDGFNQLVLAARLGADDITVLRAYAKYLHQIAFPLSQAFVEATLATYPKIARMLVNLFRVRFDPERASEEAAASQVRALESALDRVDNLNEDRVLRQYLALILATLRTNHWRCDENGRRRTFLSFKFDPSQVPGLPEPKPMFEIFVYSPRFEGVHLRGGRVARGGLRWSDRPEDFRTEILGLVKAQMVKNTVIVPVGSKGGFVLKKAPPAADREAFVKEGVACYQDYLRGLLDLTDNLVGGRVVPPPRVHRHDADDPYLVVAADKGTATFSDYANAVSKEYGFWLADAFASGGSVGYDHKVMGITARGAWESVKRHFREMGIDTQTTDFTVAGIGDMSGDVFGNGMLLSRHIRLVAAFDHRHIFLDPDPDAEASFLERERLFQLPRSSWADYTAQFISTGGGVYPRSVKSVPLSPEVRRVLDLEVESLSPNELISAILKAPVDLLYNGGIGTYVKSAQESHADVGDRANDAVRVDGRQLRCKVVGEGGNLGLTQLGRVEYAMAGGRIFTDAIDNSAGVDTSDHEVNLKILFGLVVAEGELTEKRRNDLLASMTDEVGQLVLRDNYFQTQALSVAGRRAPQWLDAEQRFVQFLEKAGRIKRALEFLPDDEEIAQRRSHHQGLLNPERAVLLAYSKIWLYDELIASTVPDDPWCATALARYFPSAVREAYAAYLPRHPLRREIIATHLLNSMANRVGPTFVHRIAEASGEHPPAIVRAYLLTREVFGLVPLWRSIEVLDNEVPDLAQSEMLSECGQLVFRATLWFLRSRRLHEDMAATIEHFAPAVEAVYRCLDPLLAPMGTATEEAARIARFEAQGVPNEVARRVAAGHALYAALDMAEVASVTSCPVETVAHVYFAVSDELDVPWLQERIAALPADTYWQTLAKGAMQDDLSGLQRNVSAQVLAAGADGTVPELVARWKAANGSAVERVTRLLGELRAMTTTDAAMLSVALRELRNLA
ncbi:MAG: NAD-glutamate dehydrogenase, partial [Betaproteobacteria bacterium]|nr:NAD-glutamate dehydrogenase [Betaproteobacteria bacterium]